MNSSYCKGVASLSSCELRLFGGNNRGNCRIVLVPLTAFTYSTKILVLVAESIRWVTVGCSDIFHISSWEKKEIAERKHSKAILDEQGRMKLTWGVRVTFEDLANPLYWVSVASHLPPWLLLSSYGVVAEQPVFLRSQSYNAPIGLVHPSWKCGPVTIPGLPLASPRWLLCFRVPLWRARSLSWSDWDPSGSGDFKIKHLTQGKLL